MSQQQQVLHAIAPGDLVHVRMTNNTEYLCSVGCFTSYGPILIASELIVRSWTEVELMPPF